MPRKKQLENYEQKLRESFDQWQHLYEYGGQDPFWPGGTNINLVRNHILYYKRQIEETMEQGAYPEIYHRALPPEVPGDYMAKPDEIREKARASLSLYLANQDYQYLARYVDRLNPKDEKNLCVRNVLHYATGLETAINEDDLITMRRHRNPDTYLSSFQSCAKKVRELKPTENEQVSLFCVYDDLDGEDIGGEELEM